MKRQMVWSIPAKIRPLWVLVCAGILLAVITVLWISMDTGINPPTDSEHHLFTVLLYSRSIRLGGLSALWSTIRSSYVGWPPLTHLVLGTMGWAIGDQCQMLRMYGLVFSLLLLWGTYRLGSMLGCRRSATLAALLTIFSFGVTGQLRQISIDLPAAAMVIVTLLALLRTEGFSRPKATMIFGTLSALSLMTRVQSIFFLAGPLLLIVFWSLRHAPTWKERGRRVGWMVMALAVTVILSSPWWYGNLGYLWEVSTSHLDPAKVRPRGNPGFGAGLLFYFYALARLSGWPVLLTVLALLPRLLDRQARRERGSLLLLALVIGGILGVTLGVHREARYLLPTIPALAMLIGLGARRLRPGWRGALGTTLLLSVVGPTLFIAAWPIHPGSVLVKREFVEWAYVRRPIRLPEKRAAMWVAQALYRVNGHDRQGQSTYMLLAMEKDVNYVPRVAAYLMPWFPRMLFSYTSNINITNNSWHMWQRRRRWMFVLSETRRKLDLPVIWTMRANRLGNPTPLILYRVPPQSDLYGIVYRRKLLKLDEE